MNNEGENLYSKANEVLERVKEIEEISKNKQKELFGSLKIGASTTVGNYILPTIINSFLQKNPQIKIKMEIGNTEQIINKLLKFHIDIAFIEDSCEEPNIISTKWGSDSLIFFSSPEHWLAKKKKISLENLLQVHWILREEGSGTRRVFEKAVYPALSSAFIALELGSSEAIKQIVMQGAGISCLSKHTIAKELKSGDLMELPVKIFDIKRNFYRLLHKEKYQTKILTAFQEECTVC